MELKEGKYYEDANGNVYGPMREDPEVAGIWDAGEDHFMATKLHWYETGEIGGSLPFFGYYDSSYSLVKEAVIN